MIKCADCKYFQRPLPQMVGDQLISPPADALGHCRFFPPVPIIEHGAAVFGTVQVGSPLSPEGGRVPGWRVLTSSYATYPVVKDDWGCAQGQERLEVV